MFHHRLHSRIILFFVASIGLSIFGTLLGTQSSGAQQQLVYKYLYRELIKANGYTIKYNVCPIYDGKNVENLDFCPLLWKELDLPRLGNPNQTYGAFEEFVYMKNNQPMLNQSLTSSDGMTSWGRDCTINPDSTANELSPMTCLSPWAVVTQTEPLNSLSEYLYRLNGQWLLNQTKNSPDGVVKYRDCPSNTTSGILWSQCTTWTRFGSDSYFDPYIENTEYRIFSDGIPRHRQSYYYLNDRKSRLCDISESSRWPICGAFTFFPPPPPTEVAYDAYVLTLNSPIASIKDQYGATVVLPSFKGDTWPYY